MPAQTDRVVVCDVPTGSGGQTSERLTGVVVYAATHPLRVTVCATKLTTGVAACTTKSVAEKQSVVFETQELQGEFRNLPPPWWDNVIFIQLMPFPGIPYRVTSVLNELQGYKAFWQIPQ